MRWLGLLLLIASLVLPRPAGAGERTVDLALVLLTDVSRSVDQREYALMKEGYAAALTDSRVLAAITGGEHASVAILYVEFAGAYEVRTMVDWTVVHDAASAAAFAAQVKAAPRSFWGRTSISAGIEHAMAALERDLAAKGIEAVRQVQTAHYDLVLMDIQMPEMDGVTATRAIRALPEPLCQIPIIAMTANAMVEERAAYLAAGMNDHVPKPIDFGLLKQALSRARPDVGVDDR